MLFRQGVQDGSDQQGQAGVLTAKTKTRSNAAKAARKAARPRPRSSRPGVQLKARLALARRERKATLEQQAATAEILKTISTSPTDIQPTLDAITRCAARLFAPSDASIHLVEGDQITLRAHVGPHVALKDIGRVAKLYPLPAAPERGSIAWLIAGKRAAEIADTEAPGVHPRVAEIARAGRFRSILTVPLVRAETGIGAISLSHPEPRFRWSERQRTLLQTFADQAVIAIENVRLFNEAKEALERQTATGEILASISGSMTDTRPVFEAIVNNLLRLFGTLYAVVFLVRDGKLDIGAIKGEPAFEKLVEAYPLPLDEQTAPGRAILTGQVMHLAPVIGNPEAPARAEQFAREYGFNAVLMAPMIREGKAIGAIGTAHRDAVPFNDKQEALIKAFADQAVIAIENVRLFNETKEALDRQTATAEILKVIASSPSDVQPVFDAIARSAYRLIGGFSTAVARVFDDVLHLVAFSSTGESGNEALKNAFPMPVSRSKAARTAVPVCISDTEALPESASALRDLARVRGFRSIVIVPLLREGVATGTISVTRREPGEFSDHQVDLLKTFADQAVIAIENVRLFNETREALERQTATSEVLQVISESPTDVQPVFDVIAERAARLTGAQYGLVFRFDGEWIHIASLYGINPQGVQALRDAWPLRAQGSTAIAARAIRNRSVINLADLLAESDADYDPSLKKIIELAGFRSVLSVPMLREQQIVGAINVNRARPGLFDEKEVDLLQTFARQAVIAIENVRLFNETREALERQTATAEILRVISSSPTDTQPVFDAIVRSAERLFDPASASILMREGDAIHLRALSPTVVNPAEVRKLFPIPFVPERIVVAHAMAQRQVVHIPDTEVAGNWPKVSEVGRAGKYRSLTVVPLIREGKGIGAIPLTHPEPGFRLTEKQLALVQTFADQAVIAIENVRLFNETKEALERQQTSAEVLRVISRSVEDTSPVFEAIVAACARLFEGHQIGINLVDAEGRIHLRACEGPNRELLHRYFNEHVESQRGTDLVLKRGVAHFPDIEGEGVPAKVRDGCRLWGAKAIVYAPMTSAGRGIGAIWVARDRVGTFSDKEIGILSTFADQAVIAIQNARLFNETKEALERQTATAEILKVISSSPTDTQPVFDAIVQSAAKLFDTWNVGVMMREDDLVHIGAVAGPNVLDLDEVAKFFPLPFDPEKIAVARVIKERRIIEIVDTEAAGEWRVVTKMARAGKYRAVTFVPLIREGEGIGTIALIRPQPGSRLTEKQLALVQTFADQAVIAIENVRLFKELEARTAALTRSVGQLTALGEVGQAISSTLDLETVLKTIVSRAVQLTGLDGGSIYEYDERTEEFHLRATENVDEEYLAVLRRTPIRKGEGAVGRAALTGEPTQIPDIRDQSYQSRLRDAFIRAGYRAVLVVPLRREEHIIGALSVTRKTPGPFAPEVVELLKTFATQSALAIQNARLFREIAEKSRQLETASRHKSDFLASMSHELRTPLNAILGFNEMILGEIYGEVPADMKGPLEDIQTSGKHLLRLINNVLDLAKIEAGRMELALSDYSVHDTVESVRSTLRPLAAEKGLEFLASVPNDLPLAYGDAGRITQCLMNLAGNSLKFTKAGKVEITVEEKDGVLTYRVADTGIGIPPEKIGSLFTEFKQTDATIASEYGGTGLGLSISRKFVEMHGGRVWVESELGKGSAFIFEIPLRASEGKAA